MFAQIDRESHIRFHCLNASVCKLSLVSGLADRLQTLLYSQKQLTYCILNSVCKHFHVETPRQIPHSYKYPHRVYLYTYQYKLMQGIKLRFVKFCCKNFLFIPSPMNRYKDEICLSVIQCRPIMVDVNLLLYK